MSNSIWKTPDQKPDVFKPHTIMVIYEAHDEPELMFSTEYATLTANRYINRWCYLDELFAQANKAERLQKRLDVIFNIIDKSRCQDVFAISNNDAWDVWGTAKGLKTDNEIKQLIKET